MALTLEQAGKIIQGARGKAAELGITVTIAVVDAGGHLVALSRMDGARFPTTDIARGKAFTAAAFQRESAQMGQNPFFATGPELGGRRVVPLGGGIPIRQGDQVVGGVGVSGGTSDQDVECAQAGLAQQ
ncbi:MAG: heme-binding protein [Dehalococcoidia bacterium]